MHVYMQTYMCVYENISLYIIAYIYQEEIISFHIEHICKKERNSALQGVGRRMEKIKKY